MNKFNEAVNTKKYDVWDDCLIPTEQDFTKVLTHKNDYDINGTSCSYISTPWGLTNSIKDSAKKIRYLFVAIALKWDDVTDKLIKILKKDGYTKEELTAIATAERHYAKDFEAILEKLYKEGMLTESIEKHDTLNPKLFGKNNRLKAEVRAKVQDIADEFIKELNNDDIKMVVKDIILIGSNVSYNYTKDSDLDVHIIADTSTLDCPDNLYPLLYGAYRCLFNSKFDIDFYGIPVEIFVETEDSKTVSNGIYSVTKNDWIKEPTIESIPDYDKDAVEKEVAKYTKKYDELINDKELKDETKVVNLIDAIYELRKKGISTDGEYSTGNLVFKEMRNNGNLDKLKEYKDELISKRLSIKESLNRKTREEAKIQISRASHNQAIIQDNGYFQIYNVPESEVDAIVARLNKLDCVESARKGAPGKFDFNRLKPIGVPTRLFGITGKIKISD